MDTYEATKIVLSRIQNLDPVNASKIMGYILIQDQGDKDMIRLAFGPETVLISLINQAKVRLGLSSNTSSAPFKFAPFSSPRITIPNNNGGFQHHDDDGDDGDGGGFHNDDEYCMYYARGFCKNGNGSKFVHGDYDAINSKIDYCEALKQQRFAAQFMASRGGHAHGHHPFSYNQRSAAAALMMSNEFHKYGRSLPDRNEFAAMALSGSLNSSSRQIYLTFPADSTFKEEDVSNYFSMYGPVQDVRIPYQQKRMFGFVTFVYPETVKLILAKGNPHFVCDSRVLVKPYKEKGTIIDKKQQQQLIDRGELSACLSPSQLESGARMLYNSDEMMLRRRIAQDAQLQHAIDLQGRRLMNFQLVDMKKQHHDNHFRSSLTPGVPSASQMQPQYQNSQGLVCSSNGISQEVLPETNGVQEPSEPPVNAADEKVPQEVPCRNNGNGSRSKEQTSNTHESDLQKSLEHILPDNLFASPKKSAAEEHVEFSTASAEADNSSPTTAATTSSTSTNDIPMLPTTSPTMAATSSSTSTNDIPMLPTTSTFNMASVKSCSFEIPRFVSGQEASET